MRRSMTAGLRGRGNISTKPGGNQGRGRRGAGNTPPSGWCDCGKRNRDCRGKCTGTPRGTAP